MLTKQVSCPSVIDPIELLRQCADRETVLLESADSETKLGKKSMFFKDLALRVQAQDNCVTVTLLCEEARPMLDAIKQAFSTHIRADSQNNCVLFFEPLFSILDVLEKMRAPSALDVLRMLSKLFSFATAKEKKLFMVPGVFSYDFLDHFEKLPRAQRDHHGFPDFLFFVPLTTIIINHRKKTTTFISCALTHSHTAVNNTALSAIEKRLDAARVLQQTQSREELCVEKSRKSTAATLRYEVDIDKRQFTDLVSQCKNYINEGHVYQIVPSRTFRMPISDPLKSYQKLRELNPSPYMFYVKSADWLLFGASPETFIKVSRGGRIVSIRPIAGTRRRGFRSDGSIDPELDVREQVSLCTDEKELAEHMMLVDLARNDVACVSEAKRRTVKRLLGVDRFSHVMHLVSQVEGRLKKNFDCLSAYQSSMNMGTLMGAPKVRAAELLRKIEHDKRGFYGGAVGYLDGMGNMDTAIIIRSALVQNNTAYVRAGCGVVYDSVPTLEAAETENKAEAVLRAIAQASEL